MKKQNLEIFKFFLIALVLIGITHTGYCQDMKQIINDASLAYSGSEGSSGNLFGFSLWGLIGGFIFSGIGFVAFIYGKKNTEYKPMMIGIALMVYPYFLRGTLALYLVGIGLTAILYFFRE